jgi:hypothetical protein
MQVMMFLISGVMLGFEITEDPETGGSAVIIDLLILRLCIFW